MSERGKYKTLGRNIGQLTRYEDYFKSIERNEKLRIRQVKVLIRYDTPDNSINSHIGFDTKTCSDQANVEGFVSEINRILLKFYEAGEIGLKGKIESLKEV